ncbi:PH domain-containing protein [Sporichthya sp.]|uniref:PH domain-containing protein n=1 Tax=Sporichthya sp. TaxID=65475 RepID=UPI0017B358F2|nr:PH domain-containing protein [Sporichthya sp.]MBA3741398.1 PH domain-containing protein [Sporichthya sp.]
MTTAVLGLGRVPSSLAGGRVLVRQPGALVTGLFLALVFGTMAVVVLIDPGPENSTGRAFLDRWVFGAVVVPALFGIRRFLLRPRIVVDETGVLLDNAFSSCALPWADIEGARGGGYVEVVGTDGDCTRALVYGPAFSGPMTREGRPTALVALIRAEAARRAGRDGPSEDYAASALVADEGPRAVATDPVIHPRADYGIAEGVALAVVWTVACAIAAGLV